MASRPEESSARLWNSESNRMTDFTRHNLVVANQARQDGQACRVGAGPAVGAQKP